MSFFPGKDPEPGDAFSCDAIETLIIPRSHDVGGFEVRRALPSSRRRLVGPFIFFDRMGPAVLQARPCLRRAPASPYRAGHRHLSVRRQGAPSRFARHRNGHRAGRREPDDGRAAASSIPSACRRSCAARPMGLSGLQTWLALPDGGEEVDPLFDHTMKADLPAFEDGGAAGRVVIGSFQGMSAPVRTASDTLYADIRLDAGAADRDSRRGGGARDLRAVGRGRESPATASPPTGCWCSGPATRSWSKARPARISCCSAAPRSARAATSGGTSSPPRRSGSSRPSRNGAAAASTSFRATRPNSFPCRRADRARSGCAPAWLCVYFGPSKAYLLGVGRQHACGHDLNEVMRS